MICAVLDEKLFDIVQPQNPTNKTKHWKTAT